MAITTSQWSHVLTIPESYTPSAATSGQTLVITESVIAKLSAGDQSTFWSNVQNGGGDVRICTDSGGVNQLPVEIVSLDNSAQTCVIWTRKPGYNGTGDLYLFIGKAGETQPPVTDPFGRNAVWVDFDVVYHFNQLNKLIDSTGNADLTEVGNLSSVTAKVGDGVDSVGNYSNRAFPSSYNGVAGNTARTVSFWSAAQSGADRGIVTWGVGGSFTNGERWSVWLQGGALRTEVQGSFKKSNTATSDNSYKRYSSIYDGGGFPSGLKHRVNGVDEVSYSEGGGQSINTGAANNLIVNGYSNLINNNIGGERLDEFSVRAFAVTDAQESTEYANQNDPATFFGTPTLATTGGGSATLVPTLIPSGEAVGTPSVTNLLKLVEANAIPTQEAVQSPVIDTGVVLISADTIPTQEVLGSPSLELLLSQIFPTDIATQENFETPLIIGGDRIAIPINDRATWNRVAAYLRTRKFKGNDNDVILTWLRSEGYIDTFNDAFNTYLEDVEALDGSLTDKYSNWRRQ